MVDVTQVDRNAAIRLLEAGDQDWQAKEVRIGQGDHFPLVQAFAAHRIAALAERDAQLLDPTVVHVNMLAGKIAKLPPEQIWHIYRRELLDAMPGDIRADAEERGRIAAYERAAEIAERELALTALANEQASSDWIDGFEFAGKRALKAIRSEANG